MPRVFLVSPHHRVMVTGSGCELAVGSDSGLVSARQLVRLGIAHVAPCDQVTYHHIVTAEGTASESPLAHDATLSGFANQSADELGQVSPEVSLNPMDPARPVLRSHEAMFALN